MAGVSKYSDEEKVEWVKLINENGGIINKALTILHEKGIDVSYPVFRKAYLDAGYKANMNYRKVKKNKKRSLKRVRRDKDNSILEIKEAIKLLEVNGFNYSVTINQLSEIGIKVASTKLLKKWWIEYGKEVCNTNRFRNTIDGLSSRLAVRHEAMADKVYSARNQILDKLIELIPKERDMNKLTNAYKALSEVIEGGPKEQNALTFISQYNSYYQNKENEQKDTDSGNIQDATPINE